LESVLCLRPVWPIGFSAPRKSPPVGMEAMSSLRRAMLAFQAQGACDFDQGRKPDIVTLFGPCDLRLVEPVRMASVWLGAC
jgi:hypothetical protein